MTIRLFHNLVWVLMLLGLSACITVDRPVQTPSGMENGFVFQDMKVVGVIRKATSTRNQPNADNMVSETVIVDVPAGTEVIVPMVQGWIMGYGEMIPDDLSDVTPEGLLNLGWEGNDHHLGIQLVNVAVTDIDAPRSDGRQTATLSVSMLLAENENDEEWFGVVGYHLICLAPQDG